jgi:hypothetical protein
MFWHWNQTNCQDSPNFSLLTYFEELSTVSDTPNEGTENELMLEDNKDLEPEQDTQTLCQ